MIQKTPVSSIVEGTIQQHKRYTDARHFPTLPSLGNLIVFLSLVLTIHFKIQIVN